VPGQRILYHLTAQDDFRCLAGDCPASCCSGWQIAVEPELVERWKALPDADDRVRFPALVRVEHQGTVTPLFMTGRDNPRCGLLTDDGLCEAHTRYGVGYTPLTCQRFPRMQEETRLIRMESASPACPVIARRIVLGDTHRPLFTRTLPDKQLEHRDRGEALALLLTGLLDRLIEANQYPVGVRLYWLAERIGQLPPNAEPDSDALASLDPEPDTLQQQLEVIESRRRDQTLRPDPVIAGSFWNTLYQLGHSRGLLAGPGHRNSVLFSGLRGLPSDRRHFYESVYAEVQAGRVAASLDRQGWYRPAANRLLQLLLLNTGFPWQPSLGDYRMSFAHAIMLDALTHLQVWITDSRDPIDVDVFARAVVRIGRTFGHNTLIPAHIKGNPALLQLNRYHHTLLDL